MCRLGSSAVGRLWAETGGVLRQRALYSITAPRDSLFGVDLGINRGRLYSKSFNYMNIVSENER